MGKKNLVRTYFLAVLWCVIAMTVLISSTYAWFTLRAVTNITPMRGTVGTADGTLLIANQPEGPFDVSCELTPDTRFQELKPVSTDDLRDFYRLDFYDATKDSYQYADAGELYFTDVIHGFLYLKSEDSAFDIYIHPEQFAVTASEQLLAALRIGFIISGREGVQTYIYKTDEFGTGENLQMVQDAGRFGNVVSSLAGGGTPAYGEDPAAELIDYRATWEEETASYRPAPRKLCHVAQDEIATVEYFIYLEGCDVHCVNALQANQLEAQFGFAGVPIKTENGREEAGLE